MLHSVGDEIVVQRAGHEANIGPWVNLARRSGAKLSWWYPGADGSAGELSELEQIVTEDTKIVALCHVSNLLGEIIDLPTIVKLVRSRASRDCQIVVDGVAYAPHRPIKVSEWGVDWYVFFNSRVGNWSDDRVFCEQVSPSRLTRCTGRTWARCSAAPRPSSWSPGRTTTSSTRGRCLTSLSSAGVPTRRARDWSPW